MDRDGHQCRDYAREETSFSECVSISAMNLTGCKVYVLTSASIHKEFCKNVSAQVGVS